MERYRLMFNKLFLLPILLLPELVFAQQEEQDNKLQQILESVVENMEAEADLTDLYYWLTYYYENPLNINKATEAELQNLFILTQSQVNNIINHRQKFGDFISIYELQAIEDLDLETINQLIPFVKTGSSGETKNYTTKQLLKNGRHEITSRYSTTFEEENGYRTSNLNNRFLGDAYGLQLRYNYRFGTQLSYGFVAEKDAGEEFFKGSQKHGFDFYSAHIYYSGEKYLKAFVLGDYHIQLGQGLVAWTSFGVGKSADVLRIARQPRGLLPSRGVNEYGFFRGAAATFQIKNFTATVFGSHQFKDANIVSSEDTISGSNEAFFSSLIYGGYHRNLTEIENKNTLQETLGGAAFGYRKNRLRLSLHGIFGGYNLNWERRISTYNQFENNTNKFGVGGASYSYLISNIYLFGEAAYSINGGNAFLQGILLSLHPRFDVGILYRNYSRSFSSPYAMAFSESTRPVNEQGTYVAASYKMSTAWRFNFYADIFKFPWLKYRTDAPTNGHEFLTDANYKPNKKLEAILRYRNKSKSLNSSVKQDKINIPVQNNLQNIRLQISYQLTPFLKLRSRAEFSIFNETGIKTERGFMAFQDVDYHFKKTPLQLSARYVFFDVESYNSRIYTFENDVKYSFSVPFLQDEGILWYILAQYRIYRGLSLEARLAQSRLYNKNTFGSGLNEINEPQRTELKVQLRYVF